MAVNNILNFGSVASVYNPYKSIVGVDDNGGQSVQFADLLNNAINQVNQLQSESEELGKEFAAGKTDNIHQVMIAAEKAEIALQFTMQIRNKIMDAYSEIMRMQI